MNTRKLRMAALVLAIGLSGTAQAELQGRDLNGSIDSFEAYYDTDLDITWLADANYAQTNGYNADGLMTWADANTWVASLSIVNTLNNITYGNWRLPTVNPINGVSFNYNVFTDGSTDGGYNISASGTAYAGNTGSEMAYMYYNTLGNPGYYTSVGAPSSCYVNSIIFCLNNVGPFSNLQASNYWSESEYTPNTDNAWHFLFGYGAQGADPKEIGCTLGL